MAQLHLQQRQANPSLNDTPDQLGSTANGRSKSARREPASDTGSRDAQHDSKRAKVAVDNPETDKAETADPADCHEACEAVMQMVQQVQGNRISRAGRDAKDCLRNLDAAEGIGVIAWLIDGLLSQRTDAKSKDLIKDWVTDLGGFIRRRTQ